MRVSSFRILLLALTLVVQTVAGGLSVAQATSSVDSQTVAHHCENMSAPDDGAPADHGSQHGMCQHCLLCAVPHVGVASRAAFVFATRSVATIGFSTPVATTVRARLSTARSARGPPSAH